MEGILSYPIYLFYFVAENLVLWARSEPLGYAVNLLQAGGRCSYEKTNVDVLDSSLEQVKANWALGHLFNNPVI